MANNYLNEMVEKVKNPSLRNFFSKKYRFFTPVNGVAASGTLTLTGVVIDGETVTIGTDVYEFCADAAQSLTASTNIAVDITSHATASQGTLTVTEQPSADETITIGTTEYTFKAVADEDGEIPLGVDEATTKLNIVAAINGTDGINTAHADVSAAAFSGDTCIITALVGGTAGDAIATTETMVNGSFDAATLGTTTAGVDCLAANADGALIGADEGTTYAMTQGTGTTVTVTAVTKGTAGNLIATTETMANGAFGAATLASGVNGTIGIAGDICIDSSYLYVAVLDNAISDANWRRLSLGSAY